ncbi:hypothetical protein KRZ98_07725 [Sphingobium sp. AS12]|uniref:DUF6878 family protein n=1 Tax=Sphingobium sp. AS12 TaxID=2849495 RepID=UPI001C317622|nr:DUF6878 family protein [Sphingobium sp. AS12]MBV2148172.1 hypothetical protein [Sphingobium sp. AS12]
MEEGSERGDGSVSPVEVDDIMARWARREAQEAQLLPVNKTNIFAILATAGMAMVLIRFDGSGDSGQIEEMEARDAQGISLPITDTPVNMLVLPWGEHIPKSETVPLGQALENITYHLLGSAHPGWENGDGAFGEFTFDVAAGTIRLDHYDRYTATEESTHHF